MWKYFQQFWQIRKQIIGVLITMFIVQCVLGELPTTVVLLIAFFFLVPPAARHQEWHIGTVLAQYGAVLFLPILAVIIHKPIAIILFGALLVCVPYVMKKPISFMQTIAVFLVGTDYLLQAVEPSIVYLIPSILAACIAYGISRLLLPLGNGIFINRRIYEQTQRLFILTNRYCLESIKITPEEFQQFRKEQQLLQATIKNYETWGIDIRTRYRSHLHLYSLVYDLNSAGIHVLYEANQRDVPRWICAEFHNSQRIHRLLLETVYQEANACPVLQYRMPECVYDQQFQHSLAIHALTQYMKCLEQAVPIWRKELCYGNHH